MLAGALLTEIKPLIEEDLHPQVIIKSFRQASAMVSCSQKKTLLQFPYQFFYGEFSVFFRTFGFFVLFFFLSSFPFFVQCLEKITELEVNIRREDSM
jgi:hypothetical protein